MAIPQRQTASPWPFVAMVGMAGSFFLYAASAEIAPWWAVVALMLCWLGLFVTACRWWTSHPTGILLLPGLAVTVWFAVLVVGSLTLDWTS